MKKIVALYVPLLNEFKIMNLVDFIERFYDGMDEEQFHSILRTYRIVPSQHQLKFVLRALEARETMLLAGDEIH